MIPCQIITPLVVGLVGGVAGQGIGTIGNRPLFPQIPPGAVGRAANIVRSLIRRGLKPRTITGPLGNLVVGTEDQDIDLLAEEAALRNLNNEVLSELLAEDPLLFIRNLPIGDPRRVAVGLDPPGTAGRLPPNATAPPGVQQVVNVPVGGLAFRASTTIAPASTRRAALFSTRRSLGRFAVR